MKFVNLHTHSFKNDPNLVEIVNQYPTDFDDKLPYYSIGIHPWYISEPDVSSQLTFVESKLTDKKCLAMGECGLDKRISVDMELQINVFRKQLILAREYQKPIIVHCVSAFQELIAIKKELDISVPIIIHGFSKKIELADQLISNGFYLSFGKYLLRNPELKSVFQKVAVDRIFLETDLISESISDIYTLAAAYKNITIENLQLSIWSNYEKVFK